MSDRGRHGRFFVCTVFAVCTEMFVGKTTKHYPNDDDDHEKHKDEMLTSNGRVIVGILSRNLAIELAEKSVSL